MDPISIAIIAFALKYAGTDLLYALRGKANLNHETKAKALSTRAQVRAQNAQLRNEKTKARLAKVKARSNKTVSPARRYAQVLKDDAFEDLLERHTRKREARKAKADHQDQDPTPGQSSGARGPARVFISNKAADARRDARKWWNDKWEAAERNRHDQKLRARPTDDVVPGDIVPNAQDEDRPGPEQAAEETEDYQGWTLIGARRPCPREGCGGTLVPTGDVHVDEGDGGASVPTTCDRDCGLLSGHDWVPSDEEYKDFFGHAFGEREDEEDSDDFHVTIPNPDDPSGSPSYDGPVGGASEYLEPGIYNTADGEKLAVGPDGSQLWHDPDLDPNPTTTPEGTTTMSNTSIEAVDLTSTIANCESTASNADEAASGIELTVAGLEASGTSGPALSHLSSAREHFEAAAAELRAGGAELESHTVVTEAYAATGGDAGEKDFVTGG